MTDPTADFEVLFSEHENARRPRRGDLVRGRLIQIGPRGMVVDLGMKRDGFIPASDLDSIPAGESVFDLGDEIDVMIVEPEDPEGNLVVSISQAREGGDWRRARRMLEDATIFEAAPVESNRGGVIVPFGSLRGFVPASHLSDLPRGLAEAERTLALSNLVGKAMPFQVIEVEPKARRLILSQRRAMRAWREQMKAEIINTLEVGEVRGGVVSGVREFGVFVDIGGADGLIHISELSWNRIEHPSDLLEEGAEIQVQVISVDKRSNRIGLSLKRLQPNPWQAAAEEISVGGEFVGRIVRHTSLGPFVRLEHDVEGLLHLGESAPLPAIGDEVKVRVISFDPDRERLDLQELGDVAQADHDEEPVISDTHMPIGKAGDHS
jgi:small subunit ribosomal protein S1